MIGQPWMASNDVPAMISAVTSNSAWLLSLYALPVRGAVLPADSMFGEERWGEWGVLRCHTIFARSSDTLI